MRAIAIIVLLLTASCSQKWHCEKCLQGSTVKRDTVVIEALVRAATASADSIFVPSFIYLAGDTIPCLPVKDSIKVGNGRIRTVIKPTRDNKGLELTSESTPDPVPVKIEVPCDTEIKNGYTLFQLILTFLAGAGVMAIAMLFKR